MSMSYPYQMPRRERRKGLEPLQHMEVLDDDADDLIREVSAVRRDTAEKFDDIRDEIQAGFKRCEKDSESVRRLLWGVAILLMTVMGGIIATLAGVVVV